MLKIEAKHPLPSFDNLLTRPEDRCLSNSYVPASPEQYIEEIGAPNYICAAEVDLTAGAGMVLRPEATVASTTEQVEPAIEVTLVPQQSRYRGHL